jgi:hypothetical protein
MPSQGSQPAAQSPKPSVLAASKTRCEGLLALVIGMKAITPPQHAASLTPDKVLVSVRRDMRWWIFDVLERVRRSGGE